MVGRNSLQQVRARCSCRFDPGLLNEVLFGGIGVTSPPLQWPLELHCSVSMHRLQPLVRCEFIWTQSVRQCTAQKTWFLSRVPQFEHGALHGSNVLSDYAEIQANGGVSG